MESRELHIGEVAEQTGLSQRSLRYYEEIGLAVPSGRTEAGYRIYTEADVARLRFLMRFKPLGFTLEETREAMAALDALDALEAGAGSGDLAALRARVAEFEAVVRARVEELRTKLAEAEALVRDLGTATR